MPQKNAGNLPARQRIVNMLRAEYERATTAFRHAHADRVATDAAANAWDQFNPEDGVGGMSTNPYNANAASRREEEAKIHAAHMKDAYEYAVDTFIEQSES
jgi:hypothetical protein